MTVNLKLTTWNAKGIMSGASYVSNLLKNRNIDIFGLSEHWLSNTNIHFLDGINSFGVSDRDLYLLSNRMFGKGGGGQRCPTIFQSLILTVIVFVVSNINCVRM